jgi:hypothetical protein
MTFLEQFQAHKGGLLKIKTDLYWYDRGRYDGNPGRVCLILDVCDARQIDSHDVDASGAANLQAEDDGKKVNSVDAFLLVDGVPRWIWLSEADVELL